MRTLGEAKANVALAQSLLEVAYVLLKERRPYQESDPKQMHNLQKEKLVRHHAKRLRQLGADNELVDEVIARLDRHDVSTSVEKENTMQLSIQPIRKASPAKVCRVALGLRARQTRKHEYKVVKKGTTGTRSPAQPQSKHAEPPEKAAETQ
jgi:hypothetical protein